DLLVEDGQTGRVLDPDVGAERELAEPPAALVEVEQGVQRLLARLGAGVDHAPAVEAQPEALEATPVAQLGERERDLALDAGGAGVGEALAVGRVARAGGPPPAPPLPPRDGVGAGRPGASLAGAREPLARALRGAGRRPPLGGRIGLVEEARGVQEALE